MSFACPTAVHCLLPANTQAFSPAQGKPGQTGSDSDNQGFPLPRPGGDSRDPPQTPFRRASCCVLSLRSTFSTAKQEAHKNITRVCLFFPYLCQDPQCVTHQSLHSRRQCRQGATSGRRGGSSCRYPQTTAGASMNTFGSLLCCC